jgi:hypothetical protein
MTNTTHGRKQESNKIQHMGENKNQTKYNTWGKTRIKQNSMHSLKASVNLGEYGRDGAILTWFLGETGMD